MFDLTQRFGYFPTVPTVLRAGGVAVRIYLPPREHEPAHVHVVGAGGKIVVTRGDANTPPALREVYRMRRRDILSAYRIVEQHQVALLIAWRRYHGAENSD